MVISFLFFVEVIWSFISPIINRIRGIEPTPPSCSPSSSTTYPEYIRIDDANGQFIGWYDVNRGIPMNRTKTSVIFPIDTKDK
jgi:hypothetical protein